MTKAASSLPRMQSYSGDDSITWVPEAQAIQIIEAWVNDVHETQPNRRHVYPLALDGLLTYWGLRVVPYEGSQAPGHVGPLYRVIRQQTPHTGHQ